MKRRALEIALAGAAALGACASGGERTQDRVMQETKAMTGATSPSGEKHPGEILHDDKVDGRTWTKKASEVPQTIAWVEVGGKWKAVVRIEITGTKDRRCFTKYGAGGEMLETTIANMGPPPRAEGPAPEPEPTPTPGEK